MEKKCVTNECIWSECGRFCSILESASIPLDKKWPLVILYLRGIKEISTLSERQKSRLQELLIVILQQKDFSDARYDAVQKTIYDIIASPYTQKLKEIGRETAQLVKDLHTMFGKHTSALSAVAGRVDTDLAGGVEPASLLAGLRDTLKGVVEQMEKDASALASLSHKDSLTGLANRRAFDLFLSAAVEAWTAVQEPVALILLDIDYFKTFNDTYGHLMGDQVLRVLGAQLTKMATSLEDDASQVLAARYGGEEFAVVLRGEVTSRAALIAENLRRMVQKTVIPAHDASVAPIPNELRVTISVGVATMWKGWKGALLTNLVDSTDKALYHAKHNGRNCTAQFVPETKDLYNLLD